ncbi:FeS assembly SUF system protein [Plasticicumulans lactativorans]|uniref:FeS assembly SUF system protein n=1 Tax=Plasticicumulans lactativorans TaxID=1133106 RepID=A0A4R2KRR5_9GAMM|nr:SUF system Fe-S cluster assembly protein [Plasticicumulans lactativorans]TCO76394.1 FeS assembly SUF system protein [Plasticicumulans lactativorans]
MNAIVNTTAELEAKVIEVLKTVYDPEIPVDIWELGLIYGLSVDPAARSARIQMTLTAPACPVAGSMPEWVENAVRSVDGIDECEVELVWDPPWNQEMMSARAKLELNLL